MKQNNTQSLRRSEPAELPKGDVLSLPKGGALSLPKGWEIKKLGEVLVKTETVDPTQKPNKEFTYLDVSSVNKETKEIEGATVLLGKDAPSRARKLIRKNDVIFATVRPSHSRVAIITEEYDGQVCSTGYFVLRGKENIDNKYFFYFLLTDEFNKQIVKLQKGANYPAVTDADVKSIFIRYPKSLPEQQRIVSILDKCFSSIDKAKANAERCLSLSKALFESELQRQLTMENGQWKMKKLQDVAKIFGRGKSKHRPRNWEGLYGGKYPFIQTGEVRNANKFINCYTQTYNEVGLAQSKLWKKGTICITIAANIAETAILDIDACIPDSIIGFEVDDKKADLNFAYYLLQYFKSELQKLGKGSAQDNINLGTFENQYFPFPPLETQRTIVRHLDHFRAETQKLERIYQQKIVSLEELKKSVLAKAFSGELKTSELGLNRFKGDKITSNNNSKILQSKNHKNHISDK